ncbi:MAG: TolC family protein, partial [Crocosphaera sp.]
MVFSHNLLRIIIVPLSATSGIFCTVSLMFIQPVQGNLNTNLSQDKLVQIDSQSTKQEMETRQQPQQQKVNLTLEDAVNLALQNNRTIKNSYLQRIIDRQELAVAEDVFAPNFIPELFLGFNQRLERDTQEVSVSGNLEVKTPIGGTLEITSESLDEGIGINNLDFRVTFDQPLLRGFGTDINRVPIEVARLEERVNIFSLKSTLITTITDTIEAYLSLLQAQEQVKIQQLALQNAKRQFEIIQVLIDAGRRAPIELVQSKT